MGAWEREIKLASITRAANPALDTRLRSCAKVDRLRLIEKSTVLNDIMLIRTRLGYGHGRWTAVNAPWFSVGGVISVRSPLRKAALLAYWAEVPHEQLDHDWYA